MGDYLLPLLANNRGVRVRVSYTSLERRIAPGRTTRALQHLRRKRMPAIGECPPQDEKKERRVQRELDHRGPPFAAPQATKPGDAARHCDSLSFEICRAIAWKFSFSSSESFDS